MERFLTISRKCTEAFSKQVGSHQHTFDATLLVYPCTHYKFSSIFLCESKLEAEEYQYLYKLPSLAAGQNVSLQLPTHMRFVQCPKGHLTHSFLATDLQAFCWTLDGYTQGKLSTVQSFQNGEVSSVAKLVSGNNQGEMIVPPMFTCNTGEQQVPYTLVCDHRPDCVDASDEDFCVFSACAGGMLACDDGMQVSAVLKALPITRKLQEK
jgi:hypothetical protein